MLKVKNNKIVAGKMSNKNRGAASRNSVAKKKKRSKQKYYAVARGRETGIFRDWYNEVEPLVSGYSNARYHGFRTLEEAQKWLDSHSFPMSAFEETRNNWALFSASMRD